MVFQNKLQFFDETLLIGKCCGRNAINSFVKHGVSSQCTMGHSYAPAIQQRLFEDGKTL